MRRVSLVVESKMTDIRSRRVADSARARIRCARGHTEDSPGLTEVLATDGQVNS
jgi:hypothetical protein